MDYLTLVLEPRTWSLYRGVGSAGELLRQRLDPPVVSGMSPANTPLLWICGPNSDSDRPFVGSLRLSDLSTRFFDWDGGRIGAIASSPDGQEAVALALPSAPADRPRLWLWNGTWNAIAEIAPDISSRLAWLEEKRIVYESAARRLVVLDLGSGSADVGPVGFYPAAATDLREWYAVSEGRVSCFSFERPFQQPQAAVQGFAFREVATLRVTRDGRVFSWTEPRFGLRSKGYIQEGGRRRQRFRAIDNGVAIGAVLGPYDLSLEPVGQSRS